jgi:hypothetical protein
MFPMSSIRIRVPEAVAVAVTSEVERRFENLGPEAFGALPHRDMLYRTIVDTLIDMTRKCAALPSISRTAGWSFRQPARPDLTTASRTLKEVHDSYADQCRRLPHILTIRKEEDLGQDSPIPIPLQDRAHPPHGAPRGHRPAPELRPSAPRPSEIVDRCARARRLPIRVAEFGAAGAQCFDQELTARPNHAITWAKNKGC